MSFVIRLAVTQPYSSESNLAVEMAGFTSCFNTRVQQSIL